MDRKPDWNVFLNIANYASVPVSDADIENKKIDKDVFLQYVRLLLFSSRNF